MLSLVALVLALLSGAAHGQDHPSKASPFDALRWTADQSPEVAIGDSWYRPLAVDGVEVDAILEFCRQRWPGQLQKRFAEDLMEVLLGLGHQAGATVSLQLLPLGGGQQLQLDDVGNTRAKRDALRDAARPTSTPPPRRAVLTREQALADVQAFAAGLRDQFAYLGLRPVDLDAELSALADALPDEVATPDLARQLHRVLMHCGDAHAAVDSAVPDPDAAPGYLPMLLGDTSAGVVAVQPDRSAFLDAEHPVLTTLDGEPLQTWLDLVRPDIVDGSPQLVRHRSLRALADFGELRRQRGLAVEDDIVVGLTSLDATSTIERSLPPARRRPSYGSWPPTSSGFLEGNLGYVRLPHMDKAAVDHLAAVLPALADTSGLIVDVRGNGGGDRKALLALARFLIGPDESPVVANIAAYRLSDRFDPDHLAPRFMYPADWAGWTAAQSQAIATAAATFRPEWPLPEGFSPWHYLVLDPSAGADAPSYGRPVVVLCDEACFSATDIFLGALSLLPRVTLLGSASGGGSARSQRFSLPESRIRVQCASMASFRPDGRLYDGRGIEVDVAVPRQPGDLLRDGTDAQLDAARALLDALTAAAPAPIPPSR